MPRKITFIGAGSLEFTRGLVRDILTFPALRDARICLMDVDEKRLEYARRGAEKIVRAGGYPATVSATLRLEEALEGSDGILITILQGGLDVWRHDIEIPKRFGVDTCVGDTRGPSGVFRFLRTAPEMLRICRLAESLCPGALILNYTNPMAMLCRVMQSETKMQVTGLCHSVQGTAAMLARFIGAPMEEITYTCAGINHQAYFLEYKRNGEDAYPALRAAVERPEVYGEEPVRSELFRALGYYCTESSGHVSEYTYWFRKRPDLIEKYCTHGTGWNPGAYAYILHEYERRAGAWEGEYLQWLDAPETSLKRGGEYASSIFNAVFGDHTPFFFNGNLPNRAILRDLPEGCCVEVPAVASREGVRALVTPQLPPQLALLVGTLARCEELAAEGFLEGNPEKIYHSVLFDPLTSAVLGTQEIRDMVNAMLERNRDYLGGFARLTV
ncbi:MAG TPA: alpha-glucosidase/alpha-galactosidase [Candidatus Limnocylindria bacterium]|nr:alpha-glucosidase/alpha-galactosidase [Candidatus Limnocylindria bacterium]